MRRLAARVTAADRELGGRRRLALAQQARGETAQVGAAVQVVGRGAAEEIGDDRHAGAHGGEELAARQPEAEEQQATAVARSRRRRLDHRHPGRQRMQPQSPARDVVRGRDDRDALQLVRGVVEARERQVQSRERPWALARQRDEHGVGRKVAVGLLAGGHRVAAGTQSRGDRHRAADRGREGEPEQPGRPGEEPRDDQADGRRGERPQQQRLGRGGEPVAGEQRAAALAVVVGVGLREQEVHRALVGEARLDAAAEPARDGRHHVEVGDRDEQTTLGRHPAGRAREHGGAQLVGDGARQCRDRLVLADERREVVLMREREAQLGRVDQPAGEQDVAEAAAGALLFGERVVQRIVREDAALDEVLAEPAQAGVIVCDGEVHGAASSVSRLVVGGCLARRRERDRR